MKKGVIKKCVQCGMERYRPQSRKEYNFCSVKCANKSRSIAKDIPCAECGKMIKRVPSNLKPINYCSYVCTFVGRRKEMEGLVIHPKSETRAGGRKRMQDKMWSSKYADKIFSDYIRKRDGKCVNCGRTTNLTCSHYWGRANSATRYDPENCDTLCWMPCHISWEKQKQGDYMTMKMRQLGKKRYNELEKRGRGFMKRSDAILQFMSWYDLSTPTRGQLK